MTKQVLFKKRFGRIIYNAEVPYIMYQAASTMSPRQFRDLFNQLLSIYKEKKRDCDHLHLIYDSRLQAKPGPAERIWFEEYWSYEMCKAGLRQMACVVPMAQIMKRHNRCVRNLLVNDEYCIKKGHFGNVEEAKQWFEAMREGYQAKQPVAVLA